MNNYVGSHWTAPLQHRAVRTLRIRLRWYFAAAFAAGLLIYLATNWSH